MRPPRPGEQGLTSLPPNRARRGLAGLAALCIGLAAASAAAAEPSLVVYDNDFFSPANTDILPLIGDGRAKVLGFTVVTGDGWRDEEAAWLLRTLEIAGRTDIPVVKGAVHPLVNTRARTLAWEKGYGRIVWKGAWNDAGPDNAFHPDDPDRIAPDPAGTPTVQAAPGSAAQFLIEQVHRHPHQVTVLAAGPLTNLALAIRLDPEFAGLAKALVVMGGFVDTNLQQVTGSANFATDFNFWFDPEAAHIVLTAPWTRITVVGDVSNAVAMSPELRARIAAKTTPMAALVARYAEPLPLWDELAAAIAVDPSLATAETEAYMDVDLDHGATYGSAHVWPEATAPHLGEQKVHIVRAVDRARFLQALVRDAQVDVGGKAP